MNAKRIAWMAALAVILGASPSLATETVTVSGRGANIVVNPSTGGVSVTAPGTVHVTTPASRDDETTKGNGPASGGVGTIVVSSLRNGTLAGVVGELSLDLGTPTMRLRPFVGAYFPNSEVNGYDRPSETDYGAGFNLELAFGKDDGHIEAIIAVASLLDLGSLDGFRALDFSGGGGIRVLFGEERRGYADVQAHASASQFAELWNVTLMGLGSFGFSF